MTAFDVIQHLCRLKWNSFRNLTQVLCFLFSSSCVLSRADAVFSFALDKTSISCSWEFSMDAAIFKLCSSELRYREGYLSGDD